MPDTKDIIELLADVQKIVDDSRKEKTAALDQVNRLDLQLSLVKEERTKVVQKPEDSNAQLTKEIQKTKARLTDQLQETQHKLDRFHPELQSLQDDLQNAEMQNNLLDIELTKKNDEIQTLETRLHAFTSLALASIPAKTPIA